MDKAALIHLSRTEAVCATFAAAAALAIPRSAWPKSQGAGTLHTKAILGTGERLEVVGLGTDKFSTGARDPIRAEIAHMVELGGTVIDRTGIWRQRNNHWRRACSTGDSRSDLSCRETDPGAGRNGAGGQAGFERSLKRLRTPRIDFLQVPNLDGVDELIPTLLK